ncbi:hypothetical protein [Clavibacter michiganensis]|uniref:hypothetical protein n=1 Tax=Clavibacter michiganensis TaxID=28447 RepID=UPI00292E2EFB|nr:hypothetical protein [Clavibacter michiganensis]
MRAAVFSPEHGGPFLVLALVIGGGLAGCASPSPAPHAAPTPRAADDPAITGAQGAAHLDDGYVQIGGGGTTVDLYIGPMCPHCREFEEPNLPALLADAAAGRAEIR